MAQTGAADSSMFQFRFGEDEVMMEISRKAPLKILDSIFREMGFRSTHQVDSLWNAGQRAYTGEDGWVLKGRNSRSYSLHKSIGKLAESMQKMTDKLFVLENAWLGLPGPEFTLYPEATHGTNSFKVVSVVHLDDGQVRFWLPGHQEAQRVVLSGSFNGWSTGDLRMSRSDSGWVSTLKLSPGKYLYKFIIDGRWENDANNRLREPDGHGSYNSVFFRYNHRFTLAGHSNVKKAFVSGSFNNWNPRQLAMRKTATGWELPMYLQEGTHHYQFVMDKKWMADPENPVQYRTPEGYLHSILQLGQAYTIELHGFEQAKSVVLTGQFNDWDHHELKMQRSDRGWTIDYVVRPGTYEYKYIIDGNWTVDPDNPHRNGQSPFENNVFSIEPNHRFRLKGHELAKSVMVTGSFNNWSESGYTMARDVEGWYIDLHLRPGKHRYKFIIDGNWVLDPDNPHWEENEFSTGNSVLWMEYAQKSNP